MLGGPEVCGIFGLIDRRGLDGTDTEVLARLSNCLRHRGPDGAGGVATTKVAIGMRRLAIIDPAGGMQPLWNENKTVALVANGEIYNFVERRKELEGRGHHFATGSDCEVIVHLYEEYGTGCLDFLRGMFAFALVDFERRKVILARDRLGEKPLFLVEGGDRIVFASELQALVGAGIVPFSLDDVAIRDYFLWGYVPEPAAPIAGVRKLAAGHFLQISLDDRQVQERRWWAPLDAPAIDGDPSELVAEALFDIGKLTIRSDVPAGVALSGGLDSNTLTSLACHYAPTNVHTFTVGYEKGGRYDESALAAADASRLGTSHHEITITDDWVVKEFSRMCRARDEPISDISGLGYLAIVTAAHEAGVPVLLFGHGADELFWGYKWPRDAVGANLRKQALLEGRAGLGNYLNFERPPYSYSGGINWAFEAGGLLTGLRAWKRDKSSPPGQMVFYDQPDWWRSAGRGLEAIVSPSFLRRVDYPPPQRLFTFSELPKRPDIEITDLLIQTYLLSNGINQIDRLAMAESVESRLPLVDYRLVEIAIGLRRTIEDWRLPPKAWLQDAMREMVPGEVANRSKRGFTPPGRRWSAAIFRSHGAALVGGLLSELDVLHDMKRPVPRFDRFGRTSSVALPALMLEMWAQGMRDLERLASIRLDTQDFPEWTRVRPTTEE